MPRLLALLAKPEEDYKPLRDEIHAMKEAIRTGEIRRGEIAGQLETCRADALSDRDEETVGSALQEAADELESAHDRGAGLRQTLRVYDQRQMSAALQLGRSREQQQVAENWQNLNDLIGASDGSRFQRHAQQFSLDVLLAYANAQLRSLAPRYVLQRGEDKLNILVVDDDMGGEIRGVHTLSGGETFLASLALALGLAELSSQRVSLESLFIDEGFGSLDADTLRMAMDALDRLQAQGRKIGVISHVQEMSDRIDVEF